MLLFHQVRGYDQRENTKFNINKEFFVVQLLGLQNLFITFVARQGGHRILLFAEKLNDIVKGIFY